MSETSVTTRTHRVLASTLAGTRALRFWEPARVAPRKKPANLIFGLEDSPPLTVTVSNGIQHVGLIAINLVYPLLVCRAVHAPVGLVADVLAMGMLVLGIGTFLQSRGVGALGTGYMCPSTFTATYFGPSLLAAQAGGLPLVFGMTVFSGVLETVIAPLLNRLRAIFPPEISGLVILMIGISAGIAGLRQVFGSAAVPMDSAEWAVGAITLASMIALNVWGKGMARMLCALLGLIAGYIAAGSAGLIDATQFSAVNEAAWIRLPVAGHVWWSFDLALIAPFAIASVAAAMKAAGTITVCQRINDADWVRPDMRSITRGVLADGVATAVAGIAGATGTNTSTPSVGLSSATGVTSRQVAYAAGAIFVLLSFFPKLTALLGVMPRAVIVPALLFTVTFIIINGLQVISSRMLDVRRTLVLGLSIIAGVTVEVFPAIGAAAPKALTPLIGSSLVFSTVIALALNLLFRIGVKKKVNLIIESTDIEPEKITTFFEEQGSLWGARPEIVKRATFGTLQLLEVLVENYWRRGPIAVEASFDEFNLDVRVTYEGDVMQFVDKRPTTEQIRESEEGARLLASFMLRRNADRVRSSSKDGSATAHFHFDH
jgi:NCS2 family nucleobase:cation symporter-2